MDYTAQTSPLQTVTPPALEAKSFSDTKDAVEYLMLIYSQSIAFLREKFDSFLAEGPSDCRWRAFYPEIRITTARHADIDNRLSYGHFPNPGSYAASVTQPVLFHRYLEQQIALLIDNHGVPVEIGTSKTQIPIHFALDADAAAGRGELAAPLRDHFDVPDLDTIDDAVVNAGRIEEPDGTRPLAPFTAQRVDYSLARLSHYTATEAQHFQNHILFTNYPFYVSEFIDFARQALADPDSGYEALVEPGNVITTAEGRIGETLGKVPQMPAYHLKRPGHAGITLVNIGVGPSNAKTATDHIAVLRPQAWIMVGHCAGLRNSQSLGDYVLAHAYVREDHVLDDDLPTWVPIPALAEVQVALEQAVAQESSLEGYELKKIMRTGTVATIDNRNWELRDHTGPVQRLSLSRAIALDMESATIAANGFRFRVPYGTLLCVSDKPLHGELKLPGMASEFYTKQVKQHLRIGIRAMELLRDMPPEKLHSRKLRSFDETAFL